MNRASIIKLVLGLAIVAIAVACFNNAPPPAQHPYPLCESGKTLPAIGPRGDAQSRA